MISRILTVVAWLGSVAPAGAQRPDFSGEWTRIVDSTTTRPSVAATGDAAFRGGDMGSGWGSPLLIRRTGDSLIVEYAHFSTYDLQPRLRFVYALDGSESRNTIMISHAGVLERSRVAWSGDTLVITTLFPAPAGPDGRPGTSTLRQALSLAPDGTLVLGTTREGAAPVHTAYRKR
jgi:hypothetical protein